MIRLLIVEDHPAVAEGLAALLAAAGDIEVVGVCTNADDADRLLAEHEVDVVLCDVMLGGSDRGFELLAGHGLSAPFLMFSAFDLPGYHQQAVAGGAAGWLSKMEEADTIVAAIRRVHDGGSSFPAHVLRSARRAPRRPTDRERELLRLLAEGATNDGLATELGVRPKTVEGVIRRLFDRYGVANRLQLVRFAQRQGWLAD